MEASVAVGKNKGNCYSEVVTPGYVKLVNISDYLKSCEKTTLALSYEHSMLYIPQ